MRDLTIHDWVLPGDEVGDELIIGRVCALHPDGDVAVAWLSNQRGLWMNDESSGDLVATDPPRLGVVEAIMVSCHPRTPWGYES